MIILLLFCMPCMAAVFIAGFYFDDQVGKRKHEIEKLKLQKELQEGKIIK